MKAKVVLRKGTRIIESWAEFTNQKGNKSFTLRHLQKEEWKVISKWLKKDYIDIDIVITSPTNIYKGQGLVTETSFSTIIDLEASFMFHGNILVEEIKQKEEPILSCTRYILHDGTIVNPHSFRFLERWLEAKPENSKYLKSRYGKDQLNQLLKDGYKNLWKHVTGLDLFIAPEPPKETEQEKEEKRKKEANKAAVIKYLSDPEIGIECIAIRPQYEEEPQFRGDLSLDGWKNAPRLKFTVTEIHTKRK